MPNKTLTKDQWQQVEKELSYPFGNVKFICDGFDIAAVVKQIKPLKHVIEIYVNDHIKGSWYMGDFEESKKFWCPKTLWLYKAPARAEAKKKLTNRRLDTWHKDFYKNIAESHKVMYSPHWSTPSAFCRNIRKTCTSIELIKVGF